MNIEKDIEPDILPYLIETFNVISNTDLTECIASVQNFGFEWLEQFCKIPSGYKEPRYVMLNVLSYYKYDREYFVKSEITLFLSKFKEKM